ncbi:uncharacterized protein [Amphiura filiformis]|uniref:uncharacterized protein n=1 Tax=Amphiura filiformis TaxID=82378 RepID=UPI003B211DBF
MARFLKYSLQMMILLMVKNTYAENLLLDCSCGCVGTGACDNPSRGLEVEFVENGFTGPQCDIIADIEECNPRNFPDNCNSWSCCHGNINGILSCTAFPRNAGGNCHDGCQWRCCFVSCECEPVETTMSPITSTTSNETTTAEQNGETTTSSTTSTAIKTTSEQQNDITTPSTDAEVVKTTISAHARTDVQSNPSQPDPGATITSSSSIQTENDSSSTVVPGASDEQSGSAGVGVGIGIAICIILAAVVVLLFYCHKRGILHKITSRAEQDEQSINRVSSEQYAEIDQNKYAGQNTIMNLNHGYNASDKDLPAASGESEYADVSPQQQSNGHAGDGIYAESGNNDENKPNAQIMMELVK